MTLFSKLKINKLLRSYPNDLIITSIKSILYNKQFLGLDINSKITGISLINDIGNIKYIDIINTSKCSNTLDSSIIIFNRLKEFKQENEKNGEIIVGVEDYLKVFFMKSSAKTLFTLAEINALVKYNCYSIFGVKPYSFHPRQAKSLFGITSQPEPIGEEEDPDKPIIKAANIGKEKVLSFVKESLLLQTNPVILPINKKGGFIKTNYDIADACLVAWLTRHNYAIEYGINNKELRDKIVNELGLKDSNFSDDETNCETIKQQYWTKRLNEIKAWGPFPPY